MKKLIAMLLCLTMFAGVLAGCGSSSAAPVAETKTAEAAAPAAEGEKALSDITIAYVTGALTTQIFRDQVDAMTKYCDEIGVKFVYTANENTDKLLEACDNYIAMGVDCLIVHTSGDTYNNAMANCQAAGIPWFSYDTKLEGDDAYYGWDNHDLG